MIQAVTFENYKVLKRANLSLGPFTLIVGPNGSGKTTALEAIRQFPELHQHPLRRVETAGRDPIEPVTVSLVWSSPDVALTATVTWSEKGSEEVFSPIPLGQPLHKSHAQVQRLLGTLARTRIYAFDGKAIAAAVALQPDMELEPNGGNLAGMLDHLRDASPERLEALNRELRTWFPEYDRILFATPASGHRAFMLRTVAGHHAIPAAALSQGTLLAIALLALAYSPAARPIICLEEPDRGLHPRLLRDAQDALYRLSHPEQFGETRPPVQVIATTHSPYMLDLYKEHPEEIVIAHKDRSGARFERLSDRTDLLELLQESHLGEVWYSGILGGVPSEG